MRVLYLHQHFASPKSNGGTRTYEFARRLLTHGHEVRMVTGSSFLAPQFQPTRPVQLMDIEGVPSVALRIPYSNKMSFDQRIRAFQHFALLATREALRYRADVVVAVSTPLTIAIPGIAGKLWQRIPLVFEVGDLWPELPIAMGALRNPLAKALAHTLEWVAYHSSAHIVALSPGMAEGVMRRGISAERVTVIPNGCDLSMFDVPASRGEAIRRRLPGLAPDQPLIVYTGTFGLINGVGYLVDVAAAMRSVAPEVRFLLVGGGAEREKVTAQARERGVLDQNLWIWDPLPKTEMPNLLAAATVATSVFIPLQAMWHNSANKFFDGLAAGKPVAINYGGWQARLLQETGAGAVLPHDDPARAAHLLAALVRDPERLQKAGTAARTLAQTQFNRDLMAQKFETVLEQATQRRQRAKRPSVSQG